MDEGIKILELAQKASDLYEKRSMIEKRQLIDFVFSNSTWKNGKLEPQYRQPFDLLVVTNRAYESKKAASSEKDGLFEIWLPGQDSNLRHAG